MPELRSKVSGLAGIAALGVGLLALANGVAGSRTGIPFDAERAPGWTKRNFVQLPKPSGLKTVTALPEPTGAPRSVDAADPMRGPVVGVEAMPTEDPYAG